MKKILSLLLTVIFVANLSAQETTSKIGNWEFGSTLFSLNSLNSKFNYEPDRAQYEIMNGVFLRYNKKRSAIRFIGSYAESNLEFDLNGVEYSGKLSRIQNRDFRLGLGGQYNPFKKRDVLYLYSDVLYRNVYTTGNYSTNYGKYQGEIAKVSNGFDTHFGLGLRLKISKSIFINPELGCVYVTKFVKNSNFNDTHYGIPRNKYTFFHFSPTFKIHLTIKL